LTCFILGSIVEILFAPVRNAMVWGEQRVVRMSLPMARAKWDAQKIDHYRFDVYMYRWGDGCRWQANIEVDDGEVITADRRSDWPSDLSQVDYPIFPPVETSPDVFFMCNYHRFTVPKLFDALEQLLQESPSTRVKVSFDLKYGFMSHARVGDEGGRGFFSRSIWHCCSGFRIENFQVLDK
jgi:hypothetical protein